MLSLRMRKRVHKKTRNHSVCTRGSLGLIEKTWKNRNIVSPAGSTSRFPNLYFCNLQCLAWDRLEIIFSFPLPPMKVSSPLFQSNAGRESGRKPLKSQQTSRPVAHQQTRAERNKRQQKNGIFQKKKSVLTVYFITLLIF